MAPHSSDSSQGLPEIHNEYTPLISNSRVESTSREKAPSTIQVSYCSSERWNFFKGIILSTISGVLFTTNNFIIKEFNVVACDAILVRGVFQVVVLSIFSWLRSYQFLPKDNKEKLFVMIQGTAGAFSFICALLSVVYMPVADALVVMFSDPLVTMVAAAIFLTGERLSILRLFLGACILGGVTLVCKPPFLFPQSHTSHEISINVNQTGLLESTNIESLEIPHDQKYWTGAGFAIAAVLTGTYHNVIVPLCKDVKSPVLVVWVGIAAILVSSIAAQFDPKALLATGHITEMPMDMWLIILGLAVSGMVAYICLTRALQLVSPTLVSSLRSLEIVFAYGVESILYSSLPSITSFFGAGLVVIGVTCIALEVHLTQLMNRFKRRRSEYDQV